ncbi:MAG: CAP domain-containing protein [Nannocystales bacterium]
MTEVSSVEEIVATFQLHCGQSAPSSVESFVEVVGAALQGEQLAEVNFEQIKNARAHRGLAPLRWSQALAEAAREDSVAMAKNGSVNARGAQPTSAGVDCMAFYRNVGAAYGPLDAHAVFMQAAVTRGPILSDRMTHGGVGVVLGPPSPIEGGPRQIWITQVLCDVLERLGPVEELEKSRQQRDNAVQVAKAEAWLRQRLNVAPDDGQAWGSLAEIQLLSARAIEEGLASATRCTELSPELAPCWLLRALALELLDDPQAAIEAYREYLVLAPDGAQADVAREALLRLAN